MAIDRKPHNISDVCWWYECPKSIDIIYHIEGHDGRHIKVDHIRIQYRTLVAAMKRAGYLKGVDDG